MTREIETKVTLHRSYETYGHLLRYQRCVLIKYEWLDFEIIDPLPDCRMHCPCNCQAATRSLYRSQQTDQNEKKERDRSDDEKSATWHVSQAIQGYRYDRSSQWLPLGFVHSGLHQTGYREVLVLGVLQTDRIRLGWKGLVGMIYCLISKETVDSQMNQQRMSIQ